MGNLSPAALYALSTAGQVLVLVMVPLRCIARLRVVYKLALEDYLMIAAEALNLVLGGVTWALIYFGAGKHYADIDPQHAKIGLQLWYTTMVLFPVVQLCVKLSIALLLLRLMANTWQKAVIYVCMVLTALMAVLSSSAAAGFCSPPSSFWLRHYEDCNVEAYKIMLDLHGAINVATDLALAVMPALVLARSSLPKGQKIATAAILAIGTGSGIATVFRIVLTPSIENMNDWLYSTTWLGLVCSLEASLAIIAGCAATFRPFFTKVKGKRVRPVDSVGADGRLSFSKEMGAETIRGDWDPGLTITYDPDLDEQIEAAPSVNLSRRSSDISLPIQAHKDFENIPDNNGWVFRKLMI